MNLPSGFFQSTARPLFPQAPLRYPPTQKPQAVPKVKFTKEEDEILIRLVGQVGTSDWSRVAQLFGSRNARQCRERYTNYLNPDLKAGEWTPEEDALLFHKAREYGPKWNHISKFFTARSDNALRNRWNLMHRHRAREITPGVVSWDSPRHVRTPAPLVHVNPAPIPQTPDVIPIKTETQSEINELTDLSGAAIKNCPLVNMDPFEIWHVLGLTRS
jgi:hypothetical protein